MNYDNLLEIKGNFALLNKNKLICLWKTKRNQFSKIYSKKQMIINKLNQIYNFHFYKENSLRIT